MAVEKSEDGSLIITGEHIQVYGLLQLAHRLALEINTGMTMSRGASAMSQARSLCGTSKRTKRGVLIDYVAFLQTNLPGGYEPSASIAKAMAK